MNPLFRSFRRSGFRRRPRFRLPPAPTGARRGGIYAALVPADDEERPARRRRVGGGSRRRGVNGDEFVVTQLQPDAAVPGRGRPVGPRGNRAEVARSQRTVGTTELDIEDERPFEVRRQFLRPPRGPDPRAEFEFLPVDLDDMPPSRSFRFGSRRSRRRVRFRRRFGPLTPPGGSRRGFGSRCRGSRLVTSGGERERERERETRGVS